MFCIFLPVFQIMIKTQTMLQNHYLSELYVLQIIQNSCIILRKLFKTDALICGANNSKLISSCENYLELMHHLVEAI